MITLLLVVIIFVLIFKSDIRGCFSVIGAIGLLSMLLGGK